MPSQRETTSQNPLRILLVEDSADDAELIGFALRNAPFTFTAERLETAEALRAALDAGTPDVVLCDYHLPSFSMAEALRIVRVERALDIPFIVVSHLIGEDAAVEAMRNGADDYLMKGRLGRLPGAIAAVLEGIRTRRGQATAESALRRSDVLNRSLLASLPMRIAVLDGAGRVAAANEAWTRAAEALGVPGPGGDYLAWLAADAGAHSAGAALRAGIEAVMARREAAFALEYPLPSAGGSRWEAVRVMPLQESEAGAVVSIEDVTPRMLSQLALHDANRRMAKLSRRILAVQEQERRALALELHDDIGQSLAALKISLFGLHRKLAGEEARAAALCLEVTDDLLAKMRRLSHSLRPPQLDSVGLAGALEMLAEQQNAATGIAIECRVRGLAPRPSPEVECAGYRIVQEAINNAARHGKPARIRIEAESRDGMLVLAIHDDGSGFDPAEARARAERQGSLGLLGMSERAELAGGRFELRSAPGTGTDITVTLPLRPPEAR
jgi:two-component system sensor histidine kinase UhpB